ncbi:MAG: BlaI/MecI/CopY family transcriptional regulator [Sphingomicrobium sp.]
MKAKNIRVSESELEVLKLLWEESPLAAADLAERIPPTRSWSLATVKTLLARLVEKGAVSTVSQGRRFLYSPALDRDTLSTRDAGNLVDRLFGGRVSPLVAQLAEERDLDSKDLDALEALIRKLRQ